MQHLVLLVAAFLPLCLASPCWCAWDCDDWERRRGYCVDYVKSRIPSFPIPRSEADVSRLNNRVPARIRRGDVALFDMGRYWHLAYVERVRRDRWGRASSIDVSEWNFGPPLTRESFRATWNQAAPPPWQRAVWCGVTEKFGRSGTRTGIPIQRVDQVWTPSPSLWQRIRSLVRP